VRGCSTGRAGAGHPAYPAVVGGPKPRPVRWRRRTRAARPPFRVAIRPTRTPGGPSAGRRPTYPGSLRPPPGPDTAGR